MLDLSGVSVAIAGVPVLRNVSLHVPAGGRVALIGRNGAGKTTTLRTLMGLVPVTAGQVMIDGEDETRLPPHHRPRHAANTSGEAGPANNAGGDGVQLGNITGRRGTRTQT